MKQNRESIGKRIRKKTVAAVTAAVMLISGMALSGETVKAEGAPFVDISTDQISLSPQAAEIKVNAADSYEYEGDGNAVIDGLSMPPVPYEAHVISADEDGYFGLIWKNTAGERKVLVNRAGAYDGSVAVGTGGDGVSLEVLSTGHWKITVTPVLTVTTPTQSGAGNMVSGLFPGDNKRHNVYCVNWADKGNFIVWLHDAADQSKKLLANGAGTYGKNKGNVYLDASHLYYLSVQSEGNWLVEFSK